MSFVTRSGQNLQLNGQNRKFGACNCYDYTNYPTNDHGQILQGIQMVDIIASAKEMGASVIRVKDFGTSYGQVGNIQPQRGTFDASEFAQIDYGVYYAGLNGIKLIGMFTDQGNSGRGWYGTFCQWRGIPVSWANFYTHPLIIADFKAWIQYFLTHVNPFTGLAYKDDPTIFAWETGNELLGSDPNCANWLTTISAYIKSIDANHLVIDGSWGAYAANAAIANVDIISDHFYPMDSGRLTTAAATAAAANKPLMIGEFDWLTDTTTPLATFLSTAQSTSNCALLSFWDLGYRGGYYGFHNYTGGDIYSVWGAGQDANKQTRIPQLRAANFTFAGQALPAHLIPATPILTFAQIGTNNLLWWRGAAAAVSYTIQSALAFSGPWTTIQSGLTDFSPPWTDTTQAGGALWYRIRATNADGISTNFSNPVQATVRGYV